MKISAQAIDGGVRLLSSRSRIAGIMLIECVAYLAILLIVSAVAIAAFYRCWNAHDAYDRNASDIERSLHAGEQWRADIRAASGPIEASRHDGVETVRIATHSGPVTYTFANSEILRDASPTGRVPILAHVKSSLMQSESRDGVAAWTWELELSPRAGIPRMRPLFTFAAVEHSGGNP